MNNETKSGYVAIIGRPNVGKSTLLNKLLGTKVSITSKKPQTTRNKILGIKTIGKTQIIFMDTPGIHKSAGKAINKIMNKSAVNALYDADLILFMVESMKWTSDDELVLSKLSGDKLKAPVFMLINKVDTVKDKDDLLPFMIEMGKKFPFKEIVPISAKNDVLDKFDRLETLICDILPYGPHYFEASQITDRDLPFRLSEIVREKLTRLLGMELPYSLTVQIEAMEKTPRNYTIHAIIWLERESQKPIVIGKGGSKLKEVGIIARKDMEELLKMPVMLKLWVKIKSGWADNKRDLTSFGYLDVD